MLIFRLNNGFINNNYKYMSIWQYESLKNLVKPEFHLTHDEGDTPMQNVLFNDIEVYIKREDLNPNQSFKDRSMAFMISKLIGEGQKKFCISSSGNAAVSAASYCSLTDVSLDCFLSPNADEVKLTKLDEFSQKNPMIKVHKVENAKSKAIKFAKENNAFNLRGSVEDDALTGYRTLGYELAEEAKDCDAIFMPISSATGMIGMYTGFKEINNKVPQIHGVQTSKIHPIAKELDTDFVPTKDSLAQCISDRTAFRKNSALEIIKETSGDAWVVNDEQILKAVEISKDLYIDNTTYNSNLAMAGFLKALEKGKKFRKVCLVFTGI